MEFRYRRTLNHIETVPGNLVAFPPHDKYQFFVHREADNPKCWSVSEVSTGMRIVEATRKRPREEAIQAARGQMERLTIERFDWYMNGDDIVTGAPKLEDDASCPSN